MNKNEVTLARLSRQINDEDRTQFVHRKPNGEARHWIEDETARRLELSDLFYPRNTQKSRISGSGQRNKRKLLFNDTNPTLVVISIWQA
ncbi:hypothetical protein E3J48_03830 [Candidatus Aerophobetes bacterium]|uniref:Uncharacterized protein n=1 Tax=Aerophobetes bacterium TaxID=2030807 RepID=A0A523W6X5_UNCAE|nr:MAG: hypothetical protein E3J48_03830 [Candidatus Aerophobetes bacterium]